MMGATCGPTALAQRLMSPQRTLVTCARPSARRPPCPPRKHTRSNSERAKFYRRQHKERTRDLISAVVVLRHDVQQLALKTLLLRGLVLCDVCGPPRDKIQSRLHAFFADPQVTLPGFTIESRRLGAVTVHGTAPQATVVEIALELEGVYPATSLEAVYHSIPGNAVLLDTLMHSRVRYACVVRLWFGSTGDFETGDVDIDWVRGLLECVGCLRDVNRVVAPFTRLGKPTLELAIGTTVDEKQALYREAV